VTHALTPKPASDGNGSKATSSDAAGTRADSKIV